MLKITSDSIVSDLVLQNYSLMPVLFLAGVSGNFYGQTVRQICKYKSINESYLLNILMVSTNDTYVPTETLPSYGVLQLTALSTDLNHFFLNELNELDSDIDKSLKFLKNENFPKGDRKTFLVLLKNAFAEYQQLLSVRSIQYEKVLLPHISTVYELYYSPDYTSERAGLINYSLEFYDGKVVLLQQSFEGVNYLLEQLLNLNSSDKKITTLVYAFYRLNKEVQIQDKLEQKLLKPMVMKMEESIIKTFHKKNKTIRRNNFVSLSTEIPQADILSPREKEVLRLVAQGYMNKEIADVLKIGMTTVITHRKKMIEKLGIKTIPGLTVYAITKGYLEDSNQTKKD